MIVDARGWLIDAFGGLAWGCEELSYQVERGDVGEKRRDFDRAG